VAELRHDPGFDLADPLPGQVEVVAHLFQRAGLAPVQPEAQNKDLTLPFVQGSQELGLVSEEDEGPPVVQAGHVVVEFQGAATYAKH
jgi:hypothetical protein